MQSKELPIGYWIKQVDELLTKGIDEIQSSCGLTRIDWQVLNSIKENGQISKYDLIALMKPLADQNSLNIIFKKFKENNMIINETEKLTLSDKGTELHKACMEKQKEFRKKAMTDISEQQYQETIITLKKMNENLT